MEVSVGDRVGLGNIVAHVVNVRKELGKSFAVYGELGGVEYFKSACFKFFLSCFNSFFGSLCGNSFVDVGQNNGAGSKSAGPVSSDGLALCNTVDNVLVEPL